MVRVERLGLGSWGWGGWGGVRCVDGGQRYWPVFRTTFMAKVDKILAKNAKLVQSLLAA